MITLVIVAAMIFLLTRKPKGLAAPVAGHSAQP
jgi:hypothetical protein